MGAAESGLSMGGFLWPTIETGAELVTAWTDVLDGGKGENIGLEQDTDFLVSSNSSLPDSAAKAQTSGPAYFLSVRLPCRSSGWAEAVADEEESGKEE